MSFFDAIFSQEGCNVDGTLSHNPVMQAMDRYLDNSDLMWQNSQIMLSDEHMAPQIHLNEQEMHVTPMTAQQPLNHHSVNFGQTHMPYGGGMMNPFMFQPHPMMRMPLQPIGPGTMNMNMGYNQHQLSHSQFDTATSTTTSSTTATAMAPAVTTTSASVVIQDDPIEEFDDSAYIIGNDMSQEEMDSLMKEMNAVDVGQDTSWDSAMNRLQDSNQDYIFRHENPIAQEYIHDQVYDNKEDLYDELYQQGMEFYQQGKINDAINSFETAIQINPNTSEAWHMLGVCHTEFDDDKKAINCFQKSLENDQYNIDSLLSLGISYVNELDSSRALECLKAWVAHNPNFQNIQVQSDEYSDGTLMDEVIQLMESVARVASDDTQVNIVLGVLYNVTNDYDHALSSFMKALGSLNESQDYALLNKIGATLANSNRSSEAIQYYSQALKIRPSYAKGWINVGISFSNLTMHEEAAKAYLQALHLNKQASHIWSYLRVSLTCLDRFDLVELTSSHNLPQLLQSLNVTPIDHQ